MIEINTQHLTVLKRFITDAERLIVSQISAPYIKKTRIRHIDGYRQVLTTINEPYKTLALSLLDDVIELARVLNEYGFEKEHGVENVEPIVERLFTTLDELLKAVDEVGYGSRSADKAT